MGTTALVIVIIVVAVLVVAGVVLVIRRARRRQELQGTFGSEYDRTVKSTGKRREAERELSGRKERHDELDIRSLSAASRERYVADWAAVQARFVDNPVVALSEADQLLTRLMAERGYPTGDAQEQTSLLSVEHSRILDNYRAGHAIEQANSSASASTEDVRQGMLNFRLVFEELLGDAQPTPYAESPPRTTTDER